MHAFTHVQRERYSDLYSSCLCSLTTWTLCLEDHSLHFLSVSPRGNYCILGCKFSVNSQDWKGYRYKDGTEHNKSSHELTCTGHFKANLYLILGSLESFFSGLPVSLVCATTSIVRKTFFFCFFYVFLFFLNMKTWGGGLSWSKVILWLWHYIKVFCIWMSIWVSSSWYLWKTDTINRPPGTPFRNPISTTEVLVAWKALEGLQ